MTKKEKWIGSVEMKLCLIIIFMCWLAYNAPIRDY
jgi:hypothetical protein